MLDANKHFAGVDYFKDPVYGFLIKETIEFDRPIPANGMLNFFELEI